MFHLTIQVVLPCFYFVYCAHNQGNDLISEDMFVCVYDTASFDG